MTYLTVIPVLHNQFAGHLGFRKLVYKFSVQVVNISITEHFSCSDLGH